MIVIYITLGVLLFTALTEWCMRVAVAASGGWPFGPTGAGAVDQALLFLACSPLPSSLGTDTLLYLGPARDSLAKSRRRLPH